MSREIHNNGQENIKCIFWNIRGICDKIKINSDTQKLLFTNDIILLYETHTDKSSEKYFNSIPGYIYKDIPRTFIHPMLPGPLVV